MNMICKMINSLNLNKEFVEVYKGFQILKFEIY